MLLPPSFLDELRDKVPLSSVIGRKVKLTRRGREYTGLCPFHHEKTPSFTINEEKGFYHCFGCGAHGDVIKYLIEAEKLPFMEAIEVLAGMAGVKIPEQTKEQKEFEAQRSNLTSIMEEACRFFQTQLFGLGGKKAKEYLIKRGISGLVAKQFRLGYAPNGSGLVQHLEAKGFNVKEAQKLGLIVKSEKTGQLHDYFYDRVMFPILDRRKRVIGFGGRMMEKGEPKYLNSPETALFHKGDQLYALPHAIETMRKKNEAILVEGYMDVIALHSAGFTNAVAPLGTAFTENQIRLLWQACDEPLICFDGDGAGRKASIRALYRALPILVPGKSMRFVGLPDPYDPDDMIRKKSPEAFARVLKESCSFADMLWNDLISNNEIDTPEKQALLEKEVKETLAKIQNETVRTYYQNDFKNRLWRYTHSRAPKKQSHIQIHTPTAGAQDMRMMLAYLICYPELAEQYLEEISNLKIAEQNLEQFIQKLTSLLIENTDISSENLRNLLGDEMLFPLKSELEMVQKSNRPVSEIQSLLDKMLKEVRRQNLKAKIEEQTKSYFENPEPEVWESIKALKAEIEKLQEEE